MIRTNISLCLKNDCLCPVILPSPQATIYHQSDILTNGIMLGHGIITLGHGIAFRILYALHTLVLSGESEESKGPMNQSNITATQKGRSVSSERTTKKATF